MLCGYDKKKKAVIWILVILTLIRVSLSLRMPLYAIGNSDFDDYLLIKYADYMGKGQWLGPYTNLTLIKGISFSVFLLLCQFTGLPYLFALTLLYIFSIILFLRAVKSLIPNFYVKGIIYLFLLYTPAMFQFTYVQRIYRMGLVVPCCLLVISCIAGLYLRRKECNKILFAWSLGAGISLAFFWHIREDSVWILPFVGCGIFITVGTFIYQYRKNIKKLVDKILILLIPFFCLLAANSFISYMNLKNYGVFTVSDRTGGSFSDMASNMLKIDGKDQGIHIWISKDTVEQVLEISPTFSQIRPQIESQFKTGQGTWASDGEIHGDLIFWAIRDAANKAGFYETADKAETFYKQVNQDIELAFQQGKIKKKQAFYPSSMGRGLTLEYVPLLFQRMGMGFKELSHYQYFYSAVLPGGEPDGVFDERIRLMESITGSLAVYRNNDPLIEATEHIVLLSNKFIRVYQLLSYLIVPLSIGSYVILTGYLLVCMRKKRVKKNVVSLWLILTGLVASVATLLAGIAWFTSWMGPETDARVFYSAGAVPLIQCFEAVSITSIFFVVKWKEKILAERIIERFKRR